jgi:hypothetical protein
VALTGVLVATPLLLSHLPHYNKFAKHYTRTVHPLPRPLFHWDGEHYMLLATQSYDQVGAETVAFYPLLPLLIRTFAWIVRNPTVAALVVTALVQLVFVLVYARHVDDGKGRGLVATALVLCHPVGFFIGVVYTEALFLALLYGFLSLRQRNHWGALAYAFFLPWCRGQGLLVGATMVMVAVLQTVLDRRLDRTRLRRAALEALAFAAGFCSLLLYMAAFTGNPWTLFDAQQEFVFNNSIANVFDPVQTWRFLTRVPTEAFAYIDAWFDKAFVVIALGLLWFSRRTDLTTGSLVVVLTVIPILMGEGGSYARFSLLPFALLAPTLADTLRPRPARLVLVLVVAAAAEVYLAGRFALNLWVS